MAPFREEDFDRIDYQILRYGASALYHRRDLFEEVAAWLKAQGYRVFRIDASSEEDFIAQMSQALRFLENFGYEPWTGNLDALNDAFRYLDFEGVEGIAFCFDRFDSLARKNPRFARTILDILESQSRDCLLEGRRLLALVQSDDPEISFDALGARSATWNQAEWMRCERGLEGASPEGASAATPSRRGIRRISTAVCLLMSLLFGFLFFRRLRLPYEDGRFFDAAEGVVYHQSSVEVYAILFGLSALMTALLFFCRRRQRRRERD